MHRLDALQVFIPVWEGTVHSDVTSGLYGYFSSLCLRFLTVPFVSPHHIHVVGESSYLPAISISSVEETDCRNRIWDCR